jgi:Ca2+-binding EF-hand superfamily protein
VQQVIELIAEYFHSRNFTVKSAFSFLDRDYSGSLVFEEFLHGFRLCTEGMGVDDDYPAEVLKPIFSLFDINQDGNLSIEEFVQAFCPKTGYGTTYYDFDFYSRTRQTPGSFSFISPATESSQMKEQRFREELFMRVASAIKRLGYSNMKLFEEVDANRSGDLTREELRQLCVFVQPDLSRTELEVIFKHFDHDNNNSITKEEFCKALENVNGAALVKVEKHVSAMAETFKKHGHSVYDSLFVFDRDGDGCLTRDEWRRAMSLFGAGGDGADEALHEHDLDFVFQRFDPGRTGLLSIAELQRFFCESVDRARCSERTFSMGRRPSSEDPLVPHEEPWETEALDSVRGRLATYTQCEFDLSEVFKRISMSRNGGLFFDEFAALIYSCSPSLSHGQVEKLFRKLDMSGDSSINYGEFVRRFG